VGLLRDSRKFSGHVPIYRAHRAVIFAIARLSCFISAAVDCLDCCYNKYLSVINAY